MKIIVLTLLISSSSAYSYGSLESIETFDFKSGKPPIKESIYKGSKKVTQRGIMTIQESRSSNPKRNISE